MYTQDQIDTVINGKKPKKEEQLFEDLLNSGKLGYVVAIRRDPIMAVKQMQKNVTEAIYRLSNPSLDEHYVNAKFSEYLDDAMRLEKLIYTHSKIDGTLERDGASKVIIDLGYPRKPFVNFGSKYLQNLLG